MPNNVEIHVHVAINYLEIGELSNARSSAIEALKYDNNFGKAYFVLGQIYEAAVEQCRNSGSYKFQDKLVLGEAYRQYTNASKFKEYTNEAELKMQYLKDFLITIEDRFFNKDKKLPNGQYQIIENCYKWIGKSL